MGNSPMCPLQTGTWGTFLLSLALKISNGPNSERRVQVICYLRIKFSLCVPYRTVRLSGSNARGFKESAR